MKRRSGGFTLVEMLVAITIMAVLTVSAVAIFARSLRSSTSIDTKQRQDEAAKNISDNLTRLIREAKIVSIAGATPVVCLTSSPVSASGADPLIFKTLDSDVNVVIDWKQSGTRGYIASNSASLSANNVNVTNFQTRWHCGEAMPDRLDMSFTIQMMAVTGYDVDTNLPAKNYSFDITLRNERK